MTTAAEDRETELAVQRRLAELRARQPNWPATLPASSGESYLDDEDDQHDSNKPNSGLAVALFGAALGLVFVAACVGVLWLGLPS